MSVVSDTLEAPDPAQTTTSGPASAAPGRSLRLPSRRTLILVGLAWIGLASIVAVRQSPSGDPRQPTGPQHFAWWWRPVERNPLLRLPATGPLARIRRHPETGALYAVGAGGIILRSTDEGRTWTQRPVTWLPEATSPQLDTPAPSRRSSNAEADDVRLASFDQSSPRNAVQQALPKKGDASEFEQKAPSYEPPAPNSAPPVPPPKPAPPVRFSALVDIAFASGRGWAVGHAGTVLQSADGGDTWSQTASGIREDLISIAPVNDGALLCAASDSGAIWRRESGDATWSASAFRGHSPTFIARRTRGDVWRSAADGLYASADCQRWELRLARSEGGGDFRELEFSEDGESGWVAADKTVFRTTDGGATWRPSRTVDGSLAFLHFADKNRGWVSNENGDVYASNDGGTSWTPYASGVTAPVALLAAGDTVLGTTESTGLLVSGDGGGTWNVRSSPHVRQVFFLPDAQHGWAIGEHGLVLATSDGGRSWSSQSSGTTSTLHDVQFLEDGRRGWAVGEQGVVLITTDGGIGWRKETVAQTAAVYLIHFQPDGRRGAAYTDSGVYVTTDGGSTWQRSSPAAAYGGPPPASVRVDDGWIVRTDARDVYRYRVGASRVQLSSDFSANAFTQDWRGWIWAVGARGVVQVSQDQGATWQRRDVGTADDLRTVAFSSDRRQGWIAGPRGVVFATRNGGDSWERREVASTAPWHRIAALSTGGAIALAGGAAMYQTRDGIEWAPIEYAAFPAPWYYVAVAIGLGILTLVLSSGPDVVVSKQPSVADVFVSDRPLERGDPDALALNRVAAGIARYLANEKTDPPLTIAITGEWGSGKTSLMNLSRAMLQDFGFRTVWFNAWHHQTEEHLLGALIESLRRNALQPWWAPRGFAVRIRLLMFRGMRQWLPAAAALVGFGIAAGYFLQQPADRLWDAGSWLKGLLNLDASRLTTEHTFDVLSILGTAGGLTRLVRGMQAFGTSGKRLSTALTTYDPLKDLRLPTGFRHQFADTFRDITRALAPQQLVIFIDDLDRCQPANVVATLEMVNFLVSSGRCIVIIGMARDRVERCVGIGFKDVAELGADEATAGDPKLLASRRLERFARQYLEKLINIEIPVPQASPTASKQLLLTAFQRREAYRQRWAASAVSLGQWLAAAVVVMALASAGYRGGIWIHNEAARIDAREREEASRQKQQESTTLAQKPVTPAAAAPSRVSEPNTERPPSEAVLVPAADGSPWWPPVAFMVGLGVLLAVPRLARVPVHVEHDSTTFTDALDRWFPLVYGKTSTPRAIKRFLNRVRFYAMSQRDAAPPEVGPHARIPEDALVALSVMQHAGASTVDEALAEVDLDVDPIWRARLQKDFEVALPYRDPFRSMSEGVSM